MCSSELCEDLQPEILRFCISIINPGESGLNYPQIVVGDDSRGVLMVVRGASAEQVAEQIRSTLGTIPDMAVFLGWHAAVGEWANSAHFKSQVALQSGRKVRA
ncbi:hypothetical protein ABT142_32285 [Streptomyces sp. NPDC001857]|uniref:hypothetical protein n=1 Tax=unclassified Streptomyces TaxID=2593676 RepID=UPI00332DF7B2